MDTCKPLQKVATIMRSVSFLLLLGVLCCQIENVPTKEYAKHPSTLWKMHLKVAKKASCTNCWICSSPPIGLTTPALVAVAVPYKLLVNDTAPFNSSLNIIMEEPYKKWWDVGMLHSNFSSWNDDICAKLREPLYVVGKHGNPHVCYKISGANRRKIGNTKCPTGVTINIPAHIDIFNKSDLNTLTVCKGKHCGSSLSKYTFTTFFILDQLIQGIGPARNMPCLGAPHPFYFLCGSAAYKILPEKVEGTCTLVALVPAAYVSEEEVDAVYQPQMMWKTKKREIFSYGDMVWSFFPQHTGWGAMMMLRLNNFSMIIDEILNETTDAIYLMNEEIREMRKLLLQEKMALDFLLASEGGFCKFIGTECCTWVADEGDLIEAHLQKMAELQHKARSIAKDGWNPFKGLGSLGDILYSIGACLQKVGVYILMLLILIIIVYVSFRCILLGVRKCTTPKNHVMLMTDNLYVLREMPFYDP